MSCKRLGMGLVMVLGLALGARAQHGGGPPGGGGPGHGGGPPAGGPPMGGRPGGGPPGGAPHDGYPTPPRSGGASGQPGGANQSQQLGPPGRWWDDAKMVKALHLTADQQKRMDTVFDQNKGALVDKYKILLKEEQTLAPMAAAAQPDEGQLMAQIDRVAQARAELKKANTHMLLAIRKELTPEQVKQLAKVAE